MNYNGKTLRFTTKDTTFTVTFTRGDGVEVITPGLTLNAAINMYLAVILTHDHATIKHGDEIVEKFDEPTNSAQEA